MEDFTLEITKRTESGTSNCNRLRKNGFVPAVVYHKGEPSISTKLSFNEFTKKARQALSSQVFRLNSEDKDLNGRPVIVRDIQIIYGRGKEELQHVDLQALKEDEEIRLNIKLKILGEAPGVKIGGGILSVMTHELGIWCLPKDIPSELKVDISALQLGKSIHASDIELPAGVRLADAEEETIVTVVASRAAIETTENATAEVATTTPATGKAPAGKAPAKAPATAPAKPAGKK